jgi:MFS family permease
MLVLLLTCLMIFAVGDGLCSLTWFDIMARAIPLKRRGRLLGMSQIISSVAGAGVGALVGFILSRSSIHFPQNYALIFTLAAVAMAPSLVGLGLVREPPPLDADMQQVELARGGWLKIVTSDLALRRLILCRVLVSMTGLATPFYVGHAADVLNLPTSIIGSFVVAQTVGGIAASALLSPISERWGPRHVVRIASGAAFVAPLFALAAHLASGGWLVRAYPFIYVLLGILNSTWILGFSNYLLEAAPDGMRPTYLGLGNTIAGVLSMVPMLGGGLLEATSYRALFGLTAAIVVFGFLFSLGLPSSKRDVVPEA